MKYAPEFFAAPSDVDADFSGFVIYTANGLFSDQSPSFSVLMVL
jgi:hypothetical protein